MPLYTRNGDSGDTDLYSGKRIKKSAETVEVLGGLDELNAFLGLTRSLLKKKDADKISLIQGDLFILGSIVAGAKLKDLDKNYIKTRILSIEKEIDLIDKRLFPLHNFILPNGCESSARLHLARAICRRCERKLVTLGKHSKFIPFLNRLSDYLFVLARYENYRRKVKDEKVILNPPL